MYSRAKNLSLGNTCQSSQMLTFLVRFWFTIIYMMLWGSVYPFFALSEHEQKITILIKVLVSEHIFVALFGFNIDTCSSAHAHKGLRKTTGSRSATVVLFQIKCNK